MATLSGFRLTLDDRWDRRWIVMWLITTPIWGTAFVVFPLRAYPDALISIGAFLVLFLAPELFSISKGDDAYPPLTHTLRHFLPNDFTFILIFGYIGSITAHWWDVPGVDVFLLGLLAAVLGWLTIHFTLSYVRADPFPGMKIRILDEPVDDEALSQLEPADLYVLRIAAADGEVIDLIAVGDRPRTVRHGWF